MTKKATGSAGGVRLSRPSQLPRRAHPSDQLAGDEPGLGIPPREDPQAQAEFFMQLLDSLAQVGSPETNRIRAALIQVVTDYRGECDKGGDVEKAREHTARKLMELEAGMCHLLLHSTSKLRDRLVAESRRMGTATKVGKSARQVADGLCVLVDALSAMMEAAKEQDPVKRSSALELMEKARVAMTAFESTP